MELLFENFSYGAVTIKGAEMPSFWGMERKKSNLDHPPPLSQSHPRVSLSMDPSCPIYKGRSGIKTLSRVPRACRELSIIPHSLS